MNLLIRHSLFAIRYSLFAICFSLFTTPAIAQSESFALRIQGGLNAAFHSASFTSTGDIIDCGELGSGVGFGPVFNGIVEIPLSKDIGLGIGVGYANRSVSFTRQNTYPIRDTALHQDLTLTTELQLASTFSFLEIQPDVRIALIDDLAHRTLGLVLGPRIALPLTSRFEQTETIVSPENAVFIVDGEQTQSRTVKSGPYTTRSQVQYGLSAGVESLINLGEKTSLVPVLSFDAFFNDLMTDATWKMWGIRAEVGIRFSFVTSQKPIQYQAPPPPPPVIAYAPISVAITGAAFVGEVITGNQLTASVPVVNAVFFDSASSSVPLTYRRSLDASIAPTDPVEAHTWVLPRIAQIINANAGSTVVLEGATSGQATEPDGVSLARDRAESVKKILVSMGVAEQKIEVAASINPRVVSNPEFAEGREENRRVDVNVRNAPLQEWVNTVRFAELRGTMSISAMRMGGDPAQRDSSKIRVGFGGKDTAVSGSTAGFASAVRIPIASDQATASLSVNASSSGNFAQKDTVIDLQNIPRRQVDLRTDDFEAILRFEYNSSELTDDVKLLLRQLAERLPDKSVIDIQGNTDKLGSEERNRVLSEQRASNTKEYINSIAKGRFDLTTSQSDKSVSDNTPQGRFLNRSIRIRVTTPQK